MLYNEMSRDTMISADRLDDFMENINEMRGNPTVSKSGMLKEWWEIFWKMLQDRSVDVDKRPDGVNYSFGNRSRNENGNEDVEQANNNNSFLKTSYLKSSVDKVTKLKSTFAPKDKKKSKQTQLEIVSSGSSSTLDFESLSGIERSLLQLGFLNRNLMKLTRTEQELIGDELKRNGVSVEAWRVYLKLCQEYQQSNTTRSSDSTNTDTSTKPYNNTTNNKEVNVMGVIDQEVQPIDSKSLLFLRQSLNQQYILKQQQQQLLNTESHGVLKMPQLPLHAIPLLSPKRTNTTTSSNPNTKPISLDSAKDYSDILNKFMT